VIGHFFNKKLGFVKERNQNFVPGTFFFEKEWFVRKMNIKNNNE
jgi:hypothetical protein